ncbi:MAG TPA: hypothetical protein VF260_10525 [Bacilli bacterium]
MLAWLIAVAAIILLVSGWKREMIGAMSGRDFVVFAAGWMLLNRVRLPIGHRLAVSAAFFFSIVFALYLMYKHAAIFRPFGNACMLMAAVFAISVCMRQLAALAPLLGLNHPEWLLSFALGFVLLLMAKQPIGQFVVLTLGLAASRMADPLFSTSDVAAPPGEASYWDEWWLTLLLARLFAEVSLLLSLLSHWVKNAGLLLRRERK